MTLSCIQQPHQHLQANLEDGVLTLAINRSEAKNALYGELYLWIAQAFDEADASKDVRVVIFRGAEQDFTAGNDMKDFMSFIQKPHEGKAGDQPPFVLLKAAARFSKPYLTMKGVAWALIFLISKKTELLLSPRKIPCLLLGVLIRFICIRRIRILQPETVSQWVGGRVAKLLI